MLEDNAELAGARTETGLSAILLAVYHGQIEIAELLLKKAPRLDIFEAAAVGNAERIREILETDAGLKNSFAPDGWTPLHLAAFFGREQAALALVEEGADLHALSKNDNRNTPLHAAVAARKANLVRLLLAAGADANAKAANDWTALHLAAFSGDPVVMEILLAQHPNLNASNHEGQTALEIAVEKKHAAVAELLRQKQTKGMK
jgi:ankyrin repeat protein